IRLSLRPMTEQWPQIDIQTHRLHPIARYSFDTRCSVQRPWFESAGKVQPRDPERHDLEPPVAAFRGVGRSMKVEPHRFEEASGERGEILGAHPVHAGADSVVNAVEPAARYDTKRERWFERREGDAFLVSEPVGQRAVGGPHESHSDIEGCPAPASRAVRA